MSLALTAGDIRNAEESAYSLYRALNDIAFGHGTIADGVTIADDALTALAIFDPAAAPWIALVKIVGALGVQAVENGWVKPDPWPEHDAQLGR